MYLLSHMNLRRICFVRIKRTPPNRWTPNTSSNPSKQINKRKKKQSLISSHVFYVYLWPHGVTLLNAELVFFLFLAFFASSTSFLSFSFSPFDEIYLETLIIFLERKIIEIFDREKNWSNNQLDLNYIKCISRIALNKFSERL